MLTLCLTSCEVDFDGGFPAQVNFPKEGGEQIYTGEIHITGLFVYKSKSDSPVAWDHDQEYETKASYDWLSINNISLNSKQVKIGVLPNTTGQPRSLYAGIANGDGEIAYILVNQD